MKYTSFGLANIVNIDFQYLIQGTISSDVLSIVTGYCSLNYVLDIQQNYQNCLHLTCTETYQPTNADLSLDKVVLL